MVSSGLSNFGYSYIALDDGWANRSSTNNTLFADPNLFPSGMAATVAYVHSKNLSFGLYGDRGNLTCLGRPGNYGFEALDSATFAEWQVDLLKVDSCYGSRSPDIDYAIWRDALNATHRPIVFVVCNPPFGTGEFGHQWRTGPDLYSQDWSMTLNRFQLATITSQRGVVGPGAIADPDNLEVGYSPRCQPGAGATVLEQQSMFSMWAFLPAPLILSADLRSITQFPEIMSILTNKDVIALNQDSLVIPANPVIGDATTPISVWSRPLANGDIGVMVLNVAGGNGNETIIGFSFTTVGCPPLPNPGQSSYLVRNLWTNITTQVFGNGYAVNPLLHEAILLRITLSP